MASHSKKDNKELENEQKQIKYKPEDLMDTDAEAEFKGGKAGFRQNKGKPEGSPSGIGSKGKGNSPPSNEQLQKEQSQEKMRPEDLKDTDADDEFKEGGKSGFRKQTDKARL